MKIALNRVFTVGKEKEDQFIELVENLDEQSTVLDERQTAEKHDTDEKIEALKEMINVVKLYLVD